MMSETQVATLTVQQSQALKVFRKRCSIIGIGILLLAAGGLLAFIISGLSFAVRVLGLMAFLLAISYLLLTLIVMQRRTGMWWHFLNAHPNWFVVPMALAGLGLWNAVAHLFSWFPLSGFVTLLIVLLSFVVQQWLRSQTQAQAEAERVLYGEHWIRLAQAWLRDMALFRIPHERA